MKIAVCTDEIYPIHEKVIQEIEGYGHKVVRFGALKSNKDEPWAKAAQEAAESILAGQCDEGVFFCWTGTGISIAANKVDGIRAALCTDSETARGARIWNHANVLALSNRLLSQDVAKEILKAWFETALDSRGVEGVKTIQEIEKKY